MLGGVDAIGGPVELGPVQHALVALFRSRDPTERLDVRDANANGIPGSEDVFHELDARERRLERRLVRGEDADGRDTVRRLLFPADGYLGPVVASMSLMFSPRVR